MQEYNKFIIMEINIITSAMKVMISSANTTKMCICSSQEQENSNTSYSMHRLNCTLI